MSSLLMTAGSFAIPYTFWYLVFHRVIGNNEVRKFQFINTCLEADVRFGVAAAFGGTRFGEVGTAMSEMLSTCMLSQHCHLMQFRVLSASFGRKLYYAVGRVPRVHDVLASSIKSGLRVFLRACVSAFDGCRPHFLPCFNEHVICDDEIFLALHRKDYTCMIYRCLGLCCIISALRVTLTRRPLEAGCRMLCTGRNRSRLRGT